jgi:site-specific DNA-adenine methylase
MINKVKIPCAFQGGKQRIANSIVDVFFRENKIDDSTKFYDLCCGSGSISIELINRGIKPSNITMLDASPWGLFWSMIGKKEFDTNRFTDVINGIPKDVSKIKDHIIKLSNQNYSYGTVYRFLPLQASSFDSKAIWNYLNKWYTQGFRGYWQPTATSNRRSPVNPMMPMPNTLLARVTEIVDQMAGVNAIHGDIRDFNDFSDDNYVIYIDPPSVDFTGYGHTFDLYDYLSTLNKKAYVSESHKMLDRSLLITESRNKGGISGKRGTKHDEWLNIHIR